MRRWLACTAALGLCGAGMLSQVAQAQTALQALPATPPRSPGPEAIYEDRVLESGPQADSGDAQAEPTSGWPRGYAVELQTTRQTGQASYNNQTLLFSGSVDTPDYGALSANLNLNRYRNNFTGLALTDYALGTPVSVTPYGYQTGNTWRFDQRGMPFEGGWFGNSSIGNINMASTPLARGTGRVSLPALSIEGVAAGLERPGNTSFNASAGKLGYFSGLSSQGFSFSHGTVGGIGAQTQLAGADGPQALGRIDAAAQYVESRNVILNGAPGFAQDTRSVWTAASWQGVAPWADALGPGVGGVSDRVGGLRVQANLAHSAGSPSQGFSLAPSDSANGAWVDANWRSELMQQQASVFRFDPSLRWGAEGLPANIQGLSWHGDINARQWQLGLSTEYSDSVSGASNSSLYNSVFGRWRFDSRDALSGNIAARTGNYAAQSGQLTWEHLSDWGFTQSRVDVARADDFRVVRAGVDQTWKVGETQTLSTSLALEQSTETGATTRSVLWGILGTTPLPGGVRLDLNLRGSNGIGGTQGSFLSANARLNWPIAGGWSFVAQYSEAHGQEMLNPAVVSALTAATQQAVLVVPSSRSLMLALRYENRAGFASAPIGGAPGVGAGRLEGHVYFDQDGNGRREASEGGVPNVTVVLNRRYVARTDAQGYYSFPSVAAGSYQIELVPDNLPLPWTPALRDGAPVQVFVRSTATADFAVQRER